MFQLLISQSSGKDKPPSIDATNAPNEHGLERKSRAIWYEAAANRRRARKGLSISAVKGTHHEKDIGS